jgi:hypothetical protein
MALSMYGASLPVFERSLGAMLKILDKGAAWAAAKKVDEAVLCATRMTPDMLPFSRQVQIACDQAKGCMARLAGVEIPKFEDTEKTIPELKARIEKTLAFCRSIKREQVDGSDGREIVLPIGGNPMKFTGEQFLLGFALPNFFFHCTTTYAILRQAGVEIGKRDFLGAA